MGGLQILSFSERVEVSGNVIRGGWGYGIALGHMLNTESPNMAGVTQLNATTSWAKVWGGRSLGDMLSNMHDYPVNTFESPTTGDLVNWTPGGPLIDVCIRDNRVTGMGLSGISTGGFANWGIPLPDPPPRFIVAINLDIHRNEIIGNLQIGDLPELPFGAGYLCVGGVCLAASVNAQIRENVIAENGVNYEMPTVGVGLIVAQGAVIQDNIIVDNGPPSDPDTRITWNGVRGGVVALEVTPIRDNVIPNSVEAIEVLMPTFNLRRNEVALTIRKNEVRQRTGKALWVLFGFGPMVATENSLHGFGDAMTDFAIMNSYLAYSSSVPEALLSRPAQGACVEIRNYGYSPAVDYGAGDIQTVIFSDPANPTIPGGAVDFSRNEVSLEWHWLNGYAASVVLSSLDSVKLTDNVMRAVMGNVFVPGPEAPPDQLFLSALLAIGGTATRSFLMVNCWAGATSTVQASGNRFEEPRYDCLFSYIGAHAPAFGVGTPDTVLTELQHRYVMTMNVGSHCLIRPHAPPVGSPTPANNVSIYQVVADCNRYASVTLGGGDQTVHIQPPTV
jgi:hypothetical protein